MAKFSDRRSSRLRISGCAQRVTTHSQLHLPNLVTPSHNPAVPANGPAIGDLKDMFGF